MINTLNSVLLEGTVYSIEKARYYNPKGRPEIEFNLEFIVDELENYIPVKAYGRLAELMWEKPTGLKVRIVGTLQTKYCRPHIEVEQIEIR